MEARISGPNTAVVVEQMIDISESFPTRPETQPDLRPMIDVPGIGKEMRHLELRRNRRVPKRRHSRHTMAPAACDQKPVVRIALPARTKTIYPSLILAASSTIRPYRRDWKSFNRSSERFSELVLRDTRTYRTALL